MPSSFSVPVVAPALEVSAEAALGAAPEIVGEADGRHRCDGRHGEADDRSHEWEPQATVVDGLRATADDELRELPATVGEAADVATGWPVRQVELGLLHLEPRPDRVDRHPRLDTEAHRDREDERASPRREPALPRQRLAHRHAAPRADQRTRRPLGNPGAPALAVPEHGDREVAAHLREGTHVADEIGIAQQERAGLELSFRQRQRLPLAAPVEPDHARTCRLCDRSGAIT